MSAILDHISPFRILHSAFSILHSSFPLLHSSIAVDLGAGSGRVFLAGLTADELLLEEVRRFHYPPRRLGGHLRWDLSHILEEIKAGLRAASIRAEELGWRIQSIGVDSWGVDYGLIDAAGRIVEDPVCYRDERTAGVMEQVFTQLPREEIHARTGIQFLSFNTIYQLFAQAQTGFPAKAERLLLIPDLINFLLTGKAVTEYTNATTTQLVNAETGPWDQYLIERLNLPAGLFTEIVPAGADLGPLKSELVQELNLSGVRVIAPATHDTGSAVAGAPLVDGCEGWRGGGWAYISSGTWSLVGVELNRPLINSEVARLNFTNEGGAFGTFRFLKNVMGLWILESCRREWKEQGLVVDYDVLLNELDDNHDLNKSMLLYPDDVRFFNPQIMMAAIAEQLAECGQNISVEPRALTKAILDSLALRYASVIRSIERLTGMNINGIQIVGGGSQNNYLNQVTANATGKPVLAGPVESTVIGNVMVQAVATGRFSTLSEARHFVARHVSLRRFEPQASAGWSDLAGITQRYAEIEARFTND
ncbi:MAG: rhamnulokinase [Acidobacteria bacterium]|nr:rhamnulokinase [Acidobacteriota bacterium]